MDVVDAEVELLVVVEPAAEAEQDEDPLHSIQDCASIHHLEI